MTDNTWAAKVLEGVEQLEAKPVKSGKPYIIVRYADVLAAIANLGAGDGLVAQATAALEGVTDGPWHYDGSLCVFGGKPPKKAMHEWKNTVCHVPMTDTITGLLTKDEAQGNARFIAFTRQWVPEAAAHITALTAQVAEKEEQLVSVLRREDATQQRHDAKMEAAEAEAAALRAKVARLGGW